jgi:hypothetical protein
MSRTLASGLEVALFLVAIWTAGKDEDKKYSCTCMESNLDHSARILFTELLRPATYKTGDSEVNSFLHSLGGIGHFVL